MTKENEHLRLYIQKKDMSFSKKLEKTFLTYGVHVLWIPAFVLTCFGLIFVYSSSSIFALEKFGDQIFFVKKNIVSICLSVCALVFASKFPIQFFIRHVEKFYASSLFLVLLTLLPVIGKKVGGASRWLNLGVFNIQPVEILKIFTIILVAKVFTQKQASLLVFSLSIFVAFLLLLLQPDFGSSFVLGASLISLFFVYGFKKRYFAMLACGLIPILTLLIFTKSYRLNRIVSYLDPFSDPLGKGFQTIQSFIAVANGGFFGKGLGESQQKLFFLPEAHTDFILAVVSEEVGFIGLLTISILYALIFYGIFRLIIFSSDITHKLIACGFFTLIILTTLINMGVVVGIFPTKGLPLPFISSGGTALIANFFMLGLLSQISKKIHENTLSG